MPATVESVRRYFLLKERETLRNQDIGLALGWRWKRFETAGTDLPADFPGLAELAALEPAYLVQEDLEGAYLEELTTAGLSRKLAQEVIAALAEL